MADLMQHVRESEFPFPERVIHLFVGGSELHGAKVHGTDDLDIYGLYIEPPDLVLGSSLFRTSCGRRQEMIGGMGRMMSTSRFTR
jgi:hypothetical protein